MRESFAFELLLAILRAFCSVEEVAQKKGISMAQVAIAWMLAKPGVTAPIIGTTSLDNLKDLIGVLSMFSRWDGLLIGDDRLGSC